MSTKVIDIRDDSYCKMRRAKVLSSLQSEGHILIARYDDASALRSFLRHPNGNRTKIVVTFERISLFVNGKLKKEERFTQDDVKIPIQPVLPTWHVTNHEKKTIESSGLISN